MKFFVLVLAFLFAGCTSETSGSTHLRATLTTNVRAHILTAANAGQSHLSTDSGDSAALGSPLDAGLASTASFQVVWASLTGTPAGTLQVEVSDDNSHWDSKSGASVSLSSASGHGMISLSGISENYYRVNYSPSTTTGGAVDVYALVK